MKQWKKKEKAMAETTFENKTKILAELWMNYRDDENFEDFISYNDLGLPLAYALAYNLISARDAGKVFIEETFKLLLVSLEVEDNDFTTLDDIFLSAPR